MCANAKPRVLVTYIEAGLGHIVTAQAISDALRDLYSDDIDIIDSFVLRDSGNAVLEKYEKYMVREVRRHSRFPGYCYLQIASMFIIGSKNTLKLVHNTVFRRELVETVKEYQKYAPDMIVCTHYYLLYAAIVYRNKFNPACKVVLYCPDNMLHGWWDNRVDMLYTNNHIATADALKFGFDKKRILEVFYPTRDAVVNTNGSVDEYREKFGIPKEKFAVVVADGVYAKARAKRVTMQLLKSEVPLTVCLIAGRNEALRRELEAITDIPEHITLKVFGFVEDAPELYAACDIFVTKAGPNAVLDSVMVGTPVIMNYYASPMEHAVVRLFGYSRGCGYYITNEKIIRKKIERLARDGTELKRLKKNCAYFDKNKNGAQEIARDIARLLKIKNGER
ncbi:MAG: glycosyltransferase [Clostridia bacterium]|nr:glycosyltransferase [Clostridia bacterium]